MEELLYLWWLATNLARKKDELKAKYLRDLFSKVYLADIVERNSYVAMWLWIPW